MSPRGAKPLLPPLAEDAHGSLMEIDVGPTQFHQFGKPQSGAIKKLQPCDITQHLPILSGALVLPASARCDLLLLLFPKLSRSLEQSVDLLEAHRNRQTFGQFRQEKVGHGIEFDFSLAQGCLVKSPQCREAQSNGARSPVASATRCTGTI